MYGVRRVLLRGAERHTLRSYTRLLAGLAAGDPDGQVSATWIATQELRHVYGARPRPGPRPVVHLLHRLRRRRPPRAAPPGPHHQRLARPAPRLLPHRPGQQRPYRGGESADQKDQAGVLWNYHIDDRLTLC